MPGLTGFVFGFALIVLFCLSLSDRCCARLNALRPLRAAGDALHRLARRRYWLLFALAMAAALFLRLYRWPNLPAGAQCDEVMSGVDAYALALYGTDRFGTSLPAMLWGWGYGQQSAFLAYFSSLFLRFMEPSLVALRLPMLLLALASLVVLWDFARRIAGRGYALIALWFCAVCPWHIMLSRWSIDANTFSLMLLFSCDALAAGLGRRPMLYVSMALFGLTMYTYGIAVYSVPVLLVALAAYLLLRSKVRPLQLIACVGIYLVVAGPLLMTMAINTFGWDTMRLGPITMQFFSESERKQDIIFFAKEPFFQRLFGDLTQYLDNTLLQRGFAENFSVRGYHTLFTFTGPMMLLGGLLLWRRRRTGMLRGEACTADGLRVTEAYILLALMASMFFAGLCTVGGHIWRINGSYFPLLLLACYALRFICRRVRIFALPVALMYLVAAVGCGVTLFGERTLGDGNTVTTRYGETNALIAARDLPFEHMYIRVGDDEDEFTAAELRVLYFHGITAAQWRGEEPLPSGKMYVDTYEYWGESDWAFEYDVEENAAYVLRPSDLETFDAEGFTLMRFYDGALAYPTQFMPQDLLTEGGDAS